MRSIQITSNEGLAGLTFVEREPAAQLTPQQVRVKVRAVSLNQRDVMIATGKYPRAVKDGVVPTSDFSGEILEVGEGVSEWQPGDRVMSTFYQNWQDGTCSPEKVLPNYGSDVDGMLQEEVVLDASCLARVPGNLDFIHACTLPCAGVTAWNALFGGRQLDPGSTVLLLGTGGVSIMALQLAKAAGMRVLITSSSDEKLARARELGAHGTINYRSTPEWQQEVKRLTGGRGADHVLEVGGEQTVTRSVESLAMGGSVAIIGGVSGFTGQFDPMLLFFGAKQMRGILVGSKAMFRQLCALIETADIQPIVDRVFEFEQVVDAFDYLSSGTHFGKVVIQVAK
ncbi:zinc-dependent alcohol dehydrogenase family protein [Microbulbifer hainanensis]|uniref:zinc-dependent alcohol dehydrogenase family protein n=1 Tax=Microbulbifer hainanensis TaxID=2735675 RepID=UPI0018674BFC|nr:NAD(P)-dependent alcohol dehydrogenase [Microbulbifer hainanensis]